MVLICATYSNKEAMYFTITCSYVLGHDSYNKQPLFPQTASSGLVFRMEKDSVLCEVGNEALYTSLVGVTIQGGAVDPQRLTCCLLCQGTFAPPCILSEQWHPIHIGKYTSCSRKYITNTLLLIITGFLATFFVSSSRATVRGASCLPVQTSSITDGLWPLLLPFLFPLYSNVQLRLSIFYVIFLFPFFHCGCCNLFPHSLVMHSFNMTIPSQSEGFCTFYNIRSLQSVLYLPVCYSPTISFFHGPIKFPYSFPFKYSERVHFFGASCPGFWPLSQNASYQSFIEF